MIAADRQNRVAFVSLGKRLEYFTIIWNLLEGIVSLVSGLFSGSISLFGFGVDSLIEVASGSIVLWKMTVDRDIGSRERNEELALKLVGFSFIGLAGCLVFQAIVRIYQQKAPQHSIPGIVIAALSFVVMPLLSTAKRTVAIGLKSSAMEADAKQADFCACMSGILLVSLLLNAAFGYWRADPFAALIMAAIIGNEGMNASVGKNRCEEHDKPMQPELELRFASPSRNSVSANPPKPRFEHRPIRGMSPRMTSYCLVCKNFVAASGQPKVLIIAEKAHICPGSKNR